MRKHATRTLFLALCLLVNRSSLLGQYTSCRAPSLEKAIDFAGLRAGGLLDTLLEVGRHSGVCFGIDVRDATVLKKQVRFTQPPRTLGETLSLVGGPVHQLTPDGILYLRFGKRSGDWLDQTIPKFTAQAGHMEETSAGLYTHLYVKANPGVGVAGDTPSSFSSPLIKSMVLMSRTVSSILDSILANSSRGGLWFTTRSHAVKMGLPSTTFWNFLVYSDSLTASRQTIKEATQFQP